MSIPIKLELTITPMLTSGKTIELFRLGLLKALKKQSREKKFGIPKIIHQKMLFNFNGFLPLNDFPVRIRIPLILAIINNVIKNK